MPSWYIDFTSCNDKRKHIVMSMTFKLKMDKTKKYDFSFSNVCFNSKSFYFIHDLFKLILFLCCLIHYATYLVCEVDNIKHILINVKTYLPRRDALKINLISDISKYIDKKHSYDFWYAYGSFKVAKHFSKFHPKHQGSTKNHAVDMKNIRIFFVDTSRMFRILVMI